MPIDDQLRKDLARYVAEQYRALAGLLTVLAAKYPETKNEPTYITAHETVMKFDAYCDKAEQ